MPSNELISYEDWSELNDLEVGIKLLENDLKRLEGKFKSKLQSLHTKYRLNPGDQIDNRGIITRINTAKEGNQNPPSNSEGEE